MKYIFHLRDTISGDTNEYHENYDWKEESDMLFQWFDNNYSCDCNRSLFLWEWNKDKELPCSMELNQIEVTKILRPDGTEVPLDY